MNNFPLSAVVAVRDTFSPVTTPNGTRASGAGMELDDAMPAFMDLPCQFIVESTVGFSAAAFEMSLSRSVATAPLRVLPPHSLSEFVYHPHFLIVCLFSDSSKNCVLDVVESINVFREISSSSFSDLDPPLGRCGVRSMFRLRKFEKLGISESQGCES